MILFFDTETTGKADFQSGPDSPRQPRLVQLGALLTTDEGKEVASIDLIIKPQGFEIPVEASAIHGITTEIAQKCGVEEGCALHVFDQLLMQSKLAVAHNFDFDKLIMSRGSRIRSSQLALSNFCTMRAMTPVCKLPNQHGYSDYKWPRLQEAHKHCFGAEFDGAHNAMADVRACASIYFWLKKQNQPAVKEEEIPF